MSSLKLFTTVLVLSAYAQCNVVSSDADTTTANYESTTAVYDETTADEVEKVDVYVYYETLCPFCMDFFENNLEPIIPRMHEHLRLHLYPYGNAGTDKIYGKYETWCQHGESECHGNKLHACAFDILKNETQSALYASCMMAAYSDDSAAIECGQKMNINATGIIECANRYSGELLLNHYGILSKKIYYPGVPYIVVNGERSYPSDLESDICKALKSPPPNCLDENVTDESTTEGSTTKSATEESTTTE